MELVLVGARLVLAGVFFVSGVAKLLDWSGTRHAVRAFGAPPALVAPVAILLPIAELVIAIALIPMATARYGAVGAFALLVLFCLGIAINLARGNTPDCHCFGQLHSEPIGWATLARNGVLAATAGFVIGFGWRDPGASAVNWLSNLSTIAAVGVGGTLVALALIAAEGWLVAHLLQQNGRILSRLERLEANSLLPGSVPAQPATDQPQVGLPVGRPAPGFHLTGLYGEILTLDALRSDGQPVMLLFSDPACGPCNALLPEVGVWQRDHAGKLTLAVISRGAVEPNRAKSTEHGITRMLLQNEQEVAASYQALATPSAVLVRPDGTIGSPIAQGAEQIRQLITRTVGRPPTIPLHPTPIRNSHNSNGNGNGTAVPQVPPARPTVPQLGDSAPSITLPDLDGNLVQLDTFLGTAILMLFWNPGCGFCQHMLDDLKAWEANRSQDATELLVISTGAVETNRAMELRSTVVLDESFTAGRAFGASGTPSAVLVSAEGKIASPLAVGASAVLALAQQPMGT